MKPVSIILLWFFWTSCTLAHPLHLSITNITYENGMLTVSMKTFLDDWETAYFHYHSKVIDFSEPGQNEIPWVGAYLTENFSICMEKGGTPLEMDIDTIKLNAESMTIEMKALLQGNPNSLYIYNSLLTDIYPDQTNLVIFGFKDRETGMKFDVKTHDNVMRLK